MNPFRRSLSRFARATRPTDDALRRALDRVDADTSTPLVDAAALRMALGPAPGAEERVRRRLARTLCALDARPAFPSGRPAAAVLATLVLIWLGWSFRSPGGAPGRGTPVADRGAATATLPGAAAPVDGAAAAALAVPLRSPAAWSQLRPTDDVALGFRGVGRLTGTARRPRVDWTSGTVAVEVAAGRGIDLEVETREAAVRVVGTGFAVRRDALGTHVSVRHGRVAVRCAGGDEIEIGAGVSADCLPVSGAGLLARARALDEGDGTREAVLGAIEEGLGKASAGDPIRDELLFLRAGVLARSGRTADALADLDRLLSTGTGVRVRDARVLRARLDASSGADDR